MEKLNFYHYSIFQCHMILQKSFKYANLVNYFSIINVENGFASCDLFFI